MNKKIVAIIIMFFTLILSTTFPAYAEEKNIKDEMAVKRETNLTCVTLSANGSAELDITLNSYSGFSREFIINAVSNNTNGMILVYLYNPKGKLVSHDWIAGVNDATRWKLTLPSSGTWHVKLYAQETTENTRCYVGWIQ